MTGNSSQVMMILDQSRHCEERSDEAIQSCKKEWIASWSLSSLRERYCARRGRAFARPVGSQ
jgi:hypothetical protein